MKMLSKISNSHYFGIGVGIGLILAGILIFISDMLGFDGKIFGIEIPIYVELVIIGCLSLIYPAWKISKE